MFAGLPECNVRTADRSPRGPFHDTIFERVLVSEVRRRDEDASGLVDPPASPSADSGPEIVVGHVHLKVADLERAIGFYADVLGFEVMQRMGPGAAFLSSGGYHHHIGLNTWESEGGDPPPPGSTGLFHVAFRYPDRAALARALRRLRSMSVPLDGAADHGVSEALYLRDPDGNGVELYCDRPRAAWPRDASGALEMYTRPLDLEDLLRA